MTMARYAIGRLLIAIPTIVGVTILVFLMVHAVPGDAAQIFLGDKYYSPELVARVRHDMGLDQPLHVQYLSYMWKLLHGDLGTSLMNGQPVARRILAALPYTVELALAALLISTVLGVGLGVLSALKHNTWVDSLAMVLALLGVCVPIYWLGLLFILFFSVHLQWFPVMGQGSLDQLVLPAFALGLLQSALLARLIRSNMLDVMSKDYLRVARAKGLRERAVVVRHALRNALIPAVTLLGLQLGSLLSGAVLTETVFARLGLGTLYVEAIKSLDITVVQGLTLIIAVSIISINLLVDLLYGVLDPRIRYE